jgi:SAM-dependent methyltransferase
MAGAPGKAKRVTQQAPHDDVLGHSTIDPNSVLDQYGRSYQAYRSGKYYLPNDALEQDRLDTVHSIYCLALGGLYLAPIHNPRFVLDLCTGTGVWAIDFAQNNPDSLVLGTDLSLIHPAQYPSNCWWMQQNAEEEWTSFRPQDYIHIRSVAGCFDNNMSVIQKCYRTLTPGGYIELQDILYDTRSYDGTHEGTSLQRFHCAFTAGLANMGRYLWAPVGYKDMLVAAGFQDVQERTTMIPCNGWPADMHLKNIGKLQRLSMEKGLQAMHKLLIVAGLSDADAVELAKRTLMDANNRNIHAYFPLYVVYGRKPLGAPQGPLPVQHCSGSAAGGLYHQLPNRNLWTQPPVATPSYHQANKNLHMADPPAELPPYYTNDQPCDYPGFSAPVAQWMPYYEASVPSDTHVT